MEKELKLRLLLRSVYLKGHQDGNLKTTDMLWEDKIIKDINKLMISREELEKLNRCQHEGCESTDLIRVCDEHINSDYPCTCRKPSQEELAKKVQILNCSFKDWQNGIFCNEDQCIMHNACILKSNQIAAAILKSLEEER